MTDQFNRVCISLGMGCMAVQYGTAWYVGSVASGKADGVNFPTTTQQLRNYLGVINNLNFEEKKNGGALGIIRYVYYSH